MHRAMRREGTFRLTGSCGWRNRAFRIRWEHGRTTPEIRATFRFSDVDAGVLTVEKLARLMTGMVAGLEAHEVLEFARLDDVYAVDPHGTPAELHDIALLISEVIEAAPLVEGDTGELTA